MDTFSSSGHAGGSFQPALVFNDPEFDVFEWHASYQSCVRYFLDHAQYVSAVQALAALMNIRLPFQQLPNPIISSKSVPTSPASAGAVGHGPTAARSAGFPPSFSLPSGPGAAPTVAGAQVTSLTPFLRRLVATGMDYPSTLHGFFGDDWVAGIGRLHEAERRNYLFAAKSEPWLSVKNSYDMEGGQYIPFLRPLREPTEKEFRAADDSWSDWLSASEEEWKGWMAMQDWVIGPRAPHGSRRPGGQGSSSGPTIKREEDD